MPEDARVAQRDLHADLTERAKVACKDARNAAKLRDRPGPPDKLCEELHVAVAMAAAKSAGSMAALQLSVRRFTVALQQEGATPEAVLIALKDVINSRTFEVTRTTATDLGEQELRQLISSWSIEEFFSASA